VELAPASSESLKPPRHRTLTIEWHPDELFARVGFIVTNMPMDPDWVVRFYNQRGTAEQHIKEGKYAIRWTRLSYRRFRDNEVRLQLHALDYNLATFLRCIDLPEAMADWSLTSLQLKLIHCLTGDACVTEKEDRGTCRPPRPRDHLPTGRGRRHRPDGARRPCRHLPIAGASVMCMTAIHVQTERRRQDRSARRAGKHHRRARTRRLRGLARPVPGVCTTEDADRGEKRLSGRADLGNFHVTGTPLGECRLDKTKHPG
jgi:hypothetical protein